MARHYWIVSDPPHNEVDLEEAALHMGLAVPEARMKVNFWAPELWLAYADVEEAAGVVQALAGAGLKALIVDARKLLDVPSPNLVQSFRFEDDQLVAMTEEGEVSMAYDSAVIGAFCRPPADFQAGDRPATSRASAASLARRSFSPGGRMSDGAGLPRAQDVLEQRATFDLYAHGEEGVRRISIAEGVTDFSGLGEGIQGAISRKMDLCIAECEQRFTGLEVDRRQVNVRPRRRVTVGTPDPAAENRRLLAFGTMELQDLLDSVSPEIGEITQYELSSRITYLTARDGEGAEADGSEEDAGANGDGAKDADAAVAVAGGDDSAEDESAGDDAGAATGDSADDESADDEDGAADDDREGKDGVKGEDDDGGRRGRRKKRKRRGKRGRR